MKKIQLLIFSIITFISIFSLSNEINRLRIIFLFRRIQYKVINPKESIFSLSIKNIVPCPKDSLTLAYLGQSNHGNNIKRSNNIIINNENVFMYDWRTNLCSQYQEPLAGTDGRKGYGHIATDNINSLLNKYSYKGRILIVGFSKGGSIVEQWSGGELSNRLDLILQRLKNKRINLDYVFWHQGESEKNDQGKKYLNQYKKDLKDVFQKIFYYYPNTHIGMALVSSCNSQSNKSLLDTQRLIIKEDKRIYLTLNTDNLGNDFRFDKCHFNWLGSEKIGGAYSDLINKLNY
tara:strand:- start:141 stop:1010 length:870 start_codon:yes stop_codon:yes gene_type:complete